MEAQNGRLAIKMFHIKHLCGWFVPHFKLNVWHASQTWGCFLPAQFCRLANYQDWVGDSHQGLGHNCPMPEPASHQGAGNLALGAWTPMLGFLHIDYLGSEEFYPQSPKLHILPCTSGMVGCTITGIRQKYLRFSSWIKLTSARGLRGLCKGQWNQWKGSYWFQWAVGHIP